MTVVLFVVVAIDVVCIGVIGVVIFIVYFLLHIYTVPVVNFCTNYTRSNWAKFTTAHLIAASFSYADATAGH